MTAAGSGLEPDPAMQVELAVRLPSQAETVPLVRSSVGDMLGTFGVAPDCVDDIRLAVSEACTNVIAHAGAGDAYEVEVHVDENVCVIDVRDTGGGFDAAALRGVPADRLSAGGRGISIMEAVMDGVGFHSGPASGTVAHLVRAVQARANGPIGRLRRTKPSGSP